MGSYDRHETRDRLDDNSYDSDGNRTSMNLFLENQNPRMIEWQHCKLFERYGPLAKVRFLWPRAEAKRFRGRNCRTVAVTNRQESERVLNKVRSKELLDFEVKLRRGKGVSTPLNPSYIHPTPLELIKPSPPGRLTLNAQPKEWLECVRRSIKERAKMIANGNEASLLPRPDEKPPEWIWKTPV